VSVRSRTLLRLGLLLSLRSRWHEWRASQISDPAARLRYLRHATGASYAGVPVWKRRRVRVAASAVVLLALVILLPAQYPRVVEAVGLERHLSFGNRPGAPGSSSQPDLPEVWMVEQKGDYEMYSNGLRIETGSTVSNEPRRILEFKAENLRIIAGSSKPAGIVYHTTESHIAPFEAKQNQRLRRVGRWLLGYVRDQRAYHYVIDRFGRVHRVVKEEDAAWHAGHSIWADGDRAFVYLNHSFLAVALESETKPGDTLTEGVTEAQIHAARTLTELLRARYGIPSGNCVTHAQVSVNPANFRIGNHTDWGGSFPFAEVGLPDNYQRPVGALVLFGFGYDDEFVRATGPRMWKGLALSEDQVRQEATARGVPAMNLRSELRQRYRSVLAHLDGAAPATAGEMAAESK
jgi:hypothetical protein